MLMKGYYLDAIREGRKHSTIRVGDKVPARPGQRLIFSNYRDSVVVRCVGLERRTLETLTDTDAQDDGFSSLRDLLQALKGHYATLTRETPLWLIRFELVTDSPQSARATDTSA